MDKQILAEVMELDISRLRAARPMLASRIERASITAPKTTPCSGCSRRFPRRELIELTEDNHDNLTYFHGDELCRECADSSGVVCYSGLRGC